MKVALIVTGVIAALVLATVLLGYALPVRHVASRERMIPASPSVVFAAIADPNRYPTWRSGLQDVQLLPPVDGKASFREKGGDGTITYVIDASEPDRRLVTRIADTGLPFGGKWTYELSPHDSGTLVRITEHGEVYNPVFRVISRFIMGHHRTIDAVLGDLERFARSRHQG